MAHPTISFTDRYSSTLQPLLLLATDYVAIIIAEWCAVLFALRGWKRGEINVS